MAKSAAERMKAFRQRKIEAGEKYPRGKGGKTKSKFESAYFVAIDGEGESKGELERFDVGKDGKTYYAKEHHYTMLAASTGESLYNGGKRLDSQSCIDFLLDLGDSHKRGIFVIFAGSYDTNHMLMYGFERSFLQELARGETKEYEYKGVRYSIEYRARKSLTIRRGLEWKETRDGIKPKWQSKITVWDVFGFFQENFVGVMKKWLGTDHRHFQLIEKMKALRGEFETIDQKIINEYNRAELESLVEIMTKVRRALEGMDLKCVRWDGAGAVAAALMRKHNIREFKEPTNTMVMEAVRTAYAGGRIELCKIGYFNGAVYDYDINSAYPSVMVDMPCMLHGIWIRGDSATPPPGFTLVHCKYRFANDMPFYPLFYRTDKMQISFPSEGEGWYWYPEYEAALGCAGNLEVIEWYTWQASCEHKPFHWIEHYYKTRQQWVKNPIEEWQKGGEKIIKLGLNSLYGKSAQQLGGRKDKPPVYHQLEWAGYITSATRARLYTAAMTNPDAVIGFATDGIFTNKPLPLPCSTTKQMGAWELKEPVPQGMVVVMAGVYWWIEEPGKFTHYSRGFDKDSMKTPDKIMEAWAAGKDGIDIPMHRLIGIGSACTSDTLWKMRGRFTQGFRTLRLDGKSHKRRGVDIYREKPHKQLVDLEPSMNQEYGYGLQGCSHPYPIVWLEAEHTEDYQNDLELIKENMDTDNI